MTLSDEVLSHSGWPSAGRGVVHGFTTKAARAGADGLDQFLGLPGLRGRFHRAARLKQVHGCEVLVEDGGVAETRTGDALVSDTPGILLTIATADCLPVLLCAPRKRPVVAAIHCGWRGLRAQIIGKTLRDLSKLFAVDARDVLACFGPAIGSRCYEIGPEIETPFGARSIVKTDGRFFLDLAMEAHCQLQAGGVAPGNITQAKWCTKCDPERFYSYRRDGPGTGRMINFIGVTAG